ncbi:MAG: DNA recombination/repair protein RecA, partial [Armatimonadota bacterium]
RIRVKVVKNKVAAPFKQAEFDVFFNRGISREGSLLDVGLELGLLTKTGTWFSYGDVRLGQGRDNSRTYLEKHPELSDGLESQIREFMTKAIVVPEVSVDEEIEPVEV